MTTTAANELGHQPDHNGHSGCCGPGGPDTRDPDPAAVDFRDAGDGAFFRNRIDFFRGKLNIPTRRWDDLWRQDHNAGFMVAGAYKADLLADLRQAVDAAVSLGESLGQFRARFDDLVKRHGWQYNGTRNWRSKLIYRTNLQTSYAAGRYRQMKSPAMIQRRPFWQYIHNDRVQFPRPHHVAWNGLILRHDDPWWDSHYPPGGWGCRCYVRALGPRQLARMGKLGPDTAPATTWREVERKATGDILRVPDGIDPGFDYIPGRDRIDDALAARLKRKAATMPDDIGKALTRKIDETKARPWSLDQHIEAGRAVLDDLAANREKLVADAIRRNPDLDTVEKMTRAWDTSLGYTSLRNELVERIEKTHGKPAAIVTEQKRGKARKLLDQVGEVMPASWVRAANDKGRLFARFSQSRAWAWTSGKDQRVRLRGGFGVVDAKAGDGYLVAGRFDTALHEYTHRVQAALPQLDKYLQDYYHRRTKGESLRHMGAGYRQSEVTRPDKFLDRYFGKWYDERARLSANEHFGALEMLPMTMDHLLSHDPHKIKRLIEDDPELASLMISLLLNFKP